MVLTLIQQGLGLRPREKRALCGKILTLDVTPTLTQSWPSISGADPALNQRITNTYFRNWYYVRVKWVTPILVITKRWMRGVLAFTTE